MKVGSKLCAWLVVMLLLLVKGKWFSYGCLEGERIALLRLKDSINFSNGESLVLRSWVDNDIITTSDCCHWPRVQCDNITKRVVQLDLHEIRDGKLLTWPFNASLFLPFQELRNLSLQQTSLEGWIKNEGFDRLSALKNLEALDLSENLFDRGILSSLSRLSSLKHLNLRFCLVDDNFDHGRLTGLDKLEVLVYNRNFPESDVYSVLSLNDFINLKELDISYNQFRSFGTNYGLRNLKVLNLAGNIFNNDIFFSLQGLSSLESLNLYDNNLTGSVQVNELHALTNLVELDLSNNEFENLNTSGDIKSSLQVLHLDVIRAANISGILQSLSGFPYLKTLYLQMNNMTIKANDQLKLLSGLEGLYLAGSFNVDATFVQSLVVLTSLKYLSLHACSLNGTLDAQGLCKLKKLAELDLSDNDYEGELPACLGNITPLWFLDLSYNSFTGNIAFSSLPKLTSLEYLSLSSNNFQIPISFNSFSNHSKLRFLFAKRNEIIAEAEMQNWVPHFQLEVFMLSNCTDHLTIPNFLWYQSELRILDLSRNKFGGSFPAWLLENNTRLRGAYLSDNAFVGPLKLPSSTNVDMETFDSSSNSLNGEIPSNLSKVFPNLVRLNMSGNDLDGGIPSSLGELKALSYLDLSANNFSGRLPQELFEVCFSLYFFKLSDNRIQGQIISGVVHLPELRHLSLDNNEFSGTIPDTLFTTSLPVLDISNNHLSGRIPKSVGNSRRLLLAVMSKNQLEGPIPDELCKLLRLDLLDLSENNLSGLFPSCFNSTSISHIYLNNNHLEGQLTNSFSGTSDISTLDLSENDFSGSIQQWIGNLSSLQVIILRGNHFEGVIPYQLCEMNVNIIDLSFNRLSGQIPRCLGNITQTTSWMRVEVTETMSTVESYLKRIMLERAYHISPEAIEEHEPELESKLTRAEFMTKRISYSYTGDILYLMSGIDLSSNELYGEIPNELGKLTEVRALNLSHNNLTGMIPETFSNLHHIESLDLSFNKLSGRIPTELIELNSLAVFSVAHNNLTGSIPEKAQFSTFNASDFAGNPFLCGRPLPVSCSGTVSIPSPSEDETQEGCFLDMEVFYISFLVTYMCFVLVVATILYINRHWREGWFDFIEVHIASFNAMC